MQVTVEGGQTVYTARLPGASEKYGRAGHVRFVSGNPMPEVSIQSNVISWGAIPIDGAKAILELRNALNEICAREHLDDFR